MERQPTGKVAEAERPLSAHSSVRAEPEIAPSPLAFARQLHHAAGNRAVGRFLQTKLQVGEAGDSYEQEADRIAQQVTSSDSGGSLEQEIASTISPLIQTKRAPAPGPVLTEADVVSGGGRPMPDGLRAKFETRFGFDFSPVRLHTDARAAESASSLNALAYTSGNDVVFGAGQYSPETPAGQRLLAHELTHVVQQSRASRSTPYVQRQPGPPLTTADEVRTDLGNDIVLGTNAKTRTGTFYFKNSAWITFSWPAGAKFDAEIMPFKPTPPDLSALEVTIRSESALTVTVDRNVRDKVLASLGGKQVGIRYNFLFPGTVTGIGFNDPTKKYKGPLRDTHQLDREPARSGFGGELEMPVIGGPEEKETIEQFNMPDSDPSFDNLQQLRKFLNDNKKKNYVVLQMPDGRYAVRELDQKKLQKLAGLVRANAYKPDQFQDLRQYRGQYSRGEFQALIIDGEEINRLDDLIDRYYPEEFLAACGHQGSVSECEIYEMSGGTYGRRQLTHDEARKRWKKFDQLTTDQIFGIETEPGHKFSSLWVKGAGKLHSLDRGYFYARDEFQQKIGDLDRATDSDMTKDIVSSMGRPFQDYLMVEMDREVDNPALIATLKGHKSVLEMLELYIHTQVEEAGQGIAIRALVEAVEQINEIVDSDEQLRNFIYRYPSLDAKRQQESLTIFGIPEDQVAKYRWALSKATNSFQIGFGAGVDGVTFIKLREFAKKNAAGTNDVIAQLRTEKIMVLRLKGEFGDAIRALTYKEFGFTTLNPKDYPHRGRAPGLFPTALAGIRSSFASGAEMLFAAQAKAFDSIDTIETALTVVAIVAATVVLIIVANAAGAVVATYLGAAEGTAGFIAIQAVVAGTLLTATDVAVDKFVFDKELSGWDILKKLGWNIGTGLGFGALGRLLKGAGFGLRLLAEGAAFMGLSTFRFYVEKGRRPTDTEFYWMAYENALMLAMLQGAAVLSKPMMDKAGIWGRGLRLGENEAKINDFIAEANRLNKDLAALADKPQRVEAEAAALKAREVEVLNRQQELLKTLNESFRTRPDAKAMQAEVKAQLEEVRAALHAIEEAQFLQGLGLKAIGNSQSLFEYEPSPAAAGRIRKFFSGSKVTEGANGRIEVLHPGETEPFVFVPKGSAAAAQAAAAAPPTPTSKLNLNTATAKELTDLPGIGKKKAEAIVAHRQKNGEFSSVDDLLKVEGVGEGTLKGVRDLVTTDPAQAKPGLQARQALLADKQEDLLGRATRMGLEDPAIAAIGKGKLRVGVTSREQTLVEAEQKLAAAEKKLNAVADAALKRTVKRLGAKAMAELRAGDLSGMSDRDVGAALSTTKDRKGLGVEELRGVLHGYRAGLNMAEFFARAASSGIPNAERNWVLDTYARMADSRIRGADQVLKEMFADAGKWVGGLWVMERARFGIGLEKIAEFESKVLGEDLQGKDVQRRHDIVLKDGSKEELKNWAEWDPYKEGLAKGFIKDVQLSGNDPKAFKEHRYVFRDPPPAPLAQIKAFLRGRLVKHLNAEVAKRSSSGEQVFTQGQADAMLRAFDAASDLVISSPERRTGSVPKPPPQILVLPVVPKPRDDQDKDKVKSGAADDDGDDDGDER